MTQAERLLWMLRDAGSAGVTVLDCPTGFRLAARIKDLRDAGHVITTHTQPLAGGAKVARYILEAPQPRPTTGIQTALALR